MHLDNCDIHENITYIKIQQELNTHFLFLVSNKCFILIYIYLSELSFH